MSSLFLFLFVTISLLLIASLSNLGTKYKKTEPFGNNEYPDFGKPIHIRLGTSCKKPYISFQAPSSHGELGCTQVPCPPESFEHLPQDIKDSIPPGFDNHLVCWECCNFH